MLTKQHFVFIFALLFVGVSGDALPCHKDKPHGKNAEDCPTEPPPPEPPPPTGGGCSLEFQVVVTDPTENNCASDSGVCIGSDLSGTYISGDEKLRAWSGDRGGMRFDSNGNSQKINGAGGTRELCFDFSATDAAGDDLEENLCSGFDLRISHQDQDPPRIALCEMENSSSQYVGLIIKFNALVDSQGGDRLHVLHYGIAGCGAKVRVDRDFAGSWVIESMPVDKVCMFREDGTLIDGTGAEFMPFRMVITDLDAL
jgi:hypothetical protein